MSRVIVAKKPNYLCSQSHISTAVKSTISYTIARSFPSVSDTLSSTSCRRRFSTLFVSLFGTVSFDVVVKCGIALVHLLFSNIFITFPI
ncbi:unnamed protein product [Linum trigynum]|uniref:Uncharacterized protein n=1 Tax=Linum trigynum TaxID=586398 RepID=A0AAV2DZQ3_9ROSI